MPYMGGGGLTSGTVTELNTTTTDVTTFAIKQNDTLPVLRRKLTDVDGNPLDLSAVDEIRFVMGLPDEGPKVNGVCTIVDTGNGEVEYAWQPGDTDTEDTYRGEFKVYQTTGDRQTVPTTHNVLRVRVYPEIA